MNGILMGSAGGEGCVKLESPLSRFVDAVYGEMHHREKGLFSQIIKFYPHLTAVYVCQEHYLHPELWFSPKLTSWFL